MSIGGKGGGGGGGGWKKIQTLTSERGKRLFGTQE